ncbi:hypothetical protein E4T48_07635 [Aureobasidium sp. EXF-10727]|nr:hypothetical protein E4T48_07635 [Aureobasidium sp. EXF-10727]
MSRPDTKTALSEALSPALFTSLHDFWFQHLEDETHLVVPSTQELNVWFVDKSDDFDNTCREKFGNALDLIITHKPTANDIIAAANPNTPLQWMSLILLLDQIPRNCYRGTSASIISKTFDPLALSVALKAKALDIHLQPDIRYRLAYRLWLFMPFEHAEDLHMQEVMVNEQRERCRDMQDLLDGDISSQEPDQAKKYCRGVLLEKREEFGACMGVLQKAVDKHYEAIKRFGRFPYRNQALGRETTMEEQEFLDAILVLRKFDAAPPSMSMITF